MELADKFCAEQNIGRIEDLVRVDLTYLIISDDCRPECGLDSNLTLSGLRKIARASLGAISRTLNFADEYTGKCTCEVQDCECTLEDIPPADWSASSGRPEKMINLTPDDPGQIARAVLENLNDYQVTCLVEILCGA